MENLSSNYEHWKIQYESPNSSEGETEVQRERKWMGALDVSLKCFTNCHHGRLSMHSFIVVGLNIMRLKNAYENFP